MNILKSMIKERGISFYFMLASLVFALATLILYAATGVNEFTPKLSEKVLALLIVFMLLTVAVSVIEVKLAKYATYIFGFWAWLEFIIWNVNYLANIFTAIDGTNFSAGFILTVVFGALAWIFVLVSAILQKNDLGSLNELKVSATTENNNE